MPKGVYIRSSPTWNKGKTKEEDPRIPRPWLGKKRSMKDRQAISRGKLGKPHPKTESGKNSFREKTSGENNYRWINDRTMLKKSNERNDSAYKDWRKSVRDRDGWLCKMANGDCLGKVVAHHILPWAKFSELRYEVNNGITLCNAHHPRRRDDEMRLSPYFQSLLVNET